MLLKQSTYIKTYSDSLNHHKNKIKISDRLNGLSSQTTCFHHCIAEYRWPCLAPFPAGKTQPTTSGQSLSHFFTCNSEQILYSISKSWSRNHWPKLLAITTYRRINIFNGSWLSRFPMSGSQLGSIQRRAGHFPKILQKSDRKRKPEIKSNRKPSHLNTYSIRGFQLMLICGHCEIEKSDTVKKWKSTFHRRWII